jgi:hypothetical protein
MNCGMHVSGDFDPNEFILDKWWPYRVAFMGMKVLDRSVRPSELE